jgi:hypothetical protein
MHTFLQELKLDSSAKVVLFDTCQFTLWRWTSDSSCYDTSFKLSIWQLLIFQAIYIIINAFQRYLNTHTKMNPKNIRKNIILIPVYSLQVQVIEGIHQSHEVCSNVLLWILKDFLFVFVFICLVVWPASSWRLLKKMIRTCVNVRDKNSPTEC